jgi:hypothetical protein
VTAAEAPNEIVANMTFATVSATIGDSQRHFFILKGFGRHLLFFGEWWLNPLVPMLLYAVIRTVMRRKMAPRPDVTGLWAFPILLLSLMGSGYYVVYLFSPYGLDWHIVSSLPRLLVQVWPSILLFWTLISTELRIEN